MASVITYYLIGLVVSRVPSSRGTKSNKTLYLCHITIFARIFLFVQPKQTYVYVSYFNNKYGLAVQLLTQLIYHTSRLEGTIPIDRFYVNDFLAASRIN